MTRPGRLFEQVPEVVKSRRKELELTQREVARRAGVSTATVSRIEKGRGSFETVDRVLGVLGLNDWLETLTAFAQAARPSRKYATFDQLAEPTVQAPIILRLSPGAGDSLAFEIRTGHRRLLCTINLYDYTAHLQGDLFPGE